MMKSSIIFALLCCVAFCSCRKDDPIDESLLGICEYEDLSGGFQGTTYYIVVDHNVTPKTYDTLLVIGDTVIIEQDCQGVYVMGENVSGPLSLDSNQEYHSYEIPDYNFPEFHYGYDIQFENDSIEILSYGNGYNSTPTPGSSTHSNYVHFLGKRIP